MKCKFCDNQARYMGFFGYLCAEHKKEKCDDPQDRLAAKALENATKTRYAEGRKKVEPRDRKNRSQATKQRLLEQAGFECHYCHKPVPTLEDVVFDHKTPISRYGEDTEENLAVACKRCDFIKGNCTEQEFRNRGLGVNRKKPYGGGKGTPKTRRFLNIKMRRMGKASRTRDILIRVLNGERVDISTYPRYVNPRRRQDKLFNTIRKHARDYDFLKMEGTEIWKCK